MKACIELSDEADKMLKAVRGSRLERHLIHNRHSSQAASVTMAKCLSSDGRPSNFKAVIFDLGGVFVPTSWQGFRDFEKSMGLKRGMLSQFIISQGDNGAWGQLEKGDLTISQFSHALKKDLSKQVGREVDIRQIVEGLSSDIVVPSPEMVAAVKCVREHGLKTALLTNNYFLDESKTKTILPVDTSLFDVVVQSCVLGHRKPDPRMYSQCLQELHVNGDQAIFLDDLGINCKAAQKFGIKTIKVGNIPQGIAELSQVLGIPLDTLAPGKVPSPPRLQLGNSSSSDEKLYGNFHSKSDLKPTNFGLEPGKTSARQQLQGMSNLSPFMNSCSTRPILTSLNVRPFSTSATSSEQAGKMAVSVEGLSPRVQDLHRRVKKFIEEHVFPLEQIRTERLNQPGVNRWEVMPQLEEAKAKAKAEGLWNLFLPLETDPGGKYGAGLTNLEYAFLCEEMGRCILAPEVFNCSAPDTGNMETILRYGTEEQKEKWLKPLLEGKIRSCFGMTEPNVASSDATNIESSIRREGDHYVINGHKWWTSGALDPRCKVCIFMGKTDTGAAKHRQQSMVLVPMDSPGIKIVRPLTVFGYDDAPEGHGEVMFENVRVPASNILLGEGRGFEIAQGRLGPGRIHHCMRLIGHAERALQLMIDRTTNRVAFGKPLAAQGSIQQDVARSRIEIEQCRLLVLKAAHMMDLYGNKVAAQEIAMIKIAAPNMAQTIIDRAIQAHGGGGLDQALPLAHLFAWARTLRLADGPDEVHLRSLARSMYAKAGKSKI